MVSAILLLIASQSSLDDRLRSFIPTAEERKWASVAWRYDLAAAREEAKRENKPLFLWVTPGQPSCDDCNTLNEERTSNLSEPVILDGIERDFIPVLVATDQVEHGRTETSRWFIKVAQFLNQRFIQGFGCAGLYICGYDGSAYSFHTNRDAESLGLFVRRGLEGFKSLPPLKTDIANDEAVRRPERGLLIVRVISRISPVPAGAPPANNFSGRDHLWIYPDEQREIVKNRSLPDRLIARVVRYHLVDNVRGLPEHWKPEEVREATIETHVISANDLAFHGRFSMETTDGARGLRGKIEGRIKFENDEIKEFRAYAECDAWGFSRTTRGAPQGVFPLVIAFYETNDPIAQVVFPQGWFSGEAYREAKLR